MGNTQSTQQLVVGFVQEVERAVQLQSAWKLSDLQPVILLIVAYYFKELQFRPHFNLRMYKYVPFRLSYTDKRMYKCSVDSETQLLALEGWKWFGVVDMKQEKCILDLTKEWVGEQSSFWLTIRDQKYVSVQVSDDEIVMYKVMADNDSYKLVRDDQYKIVDEGYIDYCDFDGEFNHFVLLVNGDTLQLRSLSNVNSIKKSIALDDKVDAVKLSANGQHCVLYDGADNPYFYVIDIENGTKQKFTSKYLENTFAPCFINGQAKYVYVGDTKGRMEIWDIDAKQPIKSMQIDTEEGIYSSASTYNILAIGSTDKRMRLYDVRTWQCLDEKQFNFDVDSLHLTDDLKYATVAGYGGNRCVVLKVD